MTSESEQKFYDTFEIEPKKLFSARQGINPDAVFYPEITTDKLLKIICILNKHYAENFQCATMLVGDTIEKIKECILKDCIEQSQHIKSEIQQLFKD